MTSTHRRRFLQLTAGVSLSPWLSSSLHAQDDNPEYDRLPLRAIGRPMPGGVNLPSTPPGRPNEQSVGIAIMGLGGYALRQIMPEFFQTQNCHVAGVVSGNGEKASRVAAAYGVPDDAIYSYDNFDAIAEDDRIDGVYIILPNGLHADWAEKCFAAGKHVLCEKPMALSSNECQRMIAASQRAGRQLMVGYRCHFEPYNLRAIELMREGAVGNIKFLRTDHTYVMGSTSPPDNWRVVRALAGGSALEDYGIYGVQAALYLTGEMPERISAAATAPANDPRFVEIAGSVAAQLRFPSGAVAQIGTSYNAAGQNRVEVRGDGGVMVMDPATSYGGNTISLRRGRSQEALSLGDSRVQFAGQLDHFAEAVSSGTANKTPGEMGLRDVRIMDAIYASAESGLTVHLTPDGRMREG